MLVDLPTERRQIEEAIMALERLARGRGKRRGRPPAIQVNEWWLLAETEVMEMAKRGVPGVWTYGFYDGSSELLYGPVPVDTYK